MARAWELENSDDEEMAQPNVLQFDGDARASLLASMEEKEDFNFGSRDGGASRRTDYSAKSGGQSTNASVNTERYGAQHEARTLETPDSVARPLKPLHASRL